MNELIEKLKNKNYVRAFGLMTPEEQECLISVGKINCMWYSMHKWQDASDTSGFFDDFTYAIKPDYQPEPEPQNELIGKTVIVYDRYHFAKPIRGKIEDVAKMDGAYKVSLFGQQHGYPNYLSFDHNYFFSQQCQILEDVPAPKCQTCNDTGFVVRTFTGSIGLETRWHPKGSIGREDEEKNSSTPQLSGL